MGRPPWRRSPEDGQLHLIRQEVGGVAEALCTHRVPVAELEEPGDENQPRCPLCVRVYGIELSIRDGRAVSPEDARLVAALTVLRDPLAPVVDEIAFGELDTKDRRELARALRTVAEALAPLVVINEAMSEPGWTASLRDER